MSNLIFSESSADPLKQEMVNDYLAQIAPSSFANTSILLLALGPILVFFFCALLVAFCKADKSVVQKKQILIGFTLCWSLVAIYGTSISSSVYAVSVKNQDIASFIHQSMFAFLLAIHLVELILFVLVCFSVAFKPNEPPISNPDTGNPDTGNPDTGNPEAAGTASSENKAGDG